MAFSVIGTRKILEIAHSRRASSASCFMDDFELYDFVGDNTWTTSSVVTTVA